MQLELPQIRKKRLVGMTPLIDVIFILLLFFMLASNFQQWRVMPLDLAGRSDVPAVADQEFTIHVGRDGVLMLDGVPLLPEQLTLLLTTRVAAHPNPTARITTEISTDLQSLVRVVDRIAAAGISKITLDAPVR
ncbi:MAG: biopolymer transporter ExbD [Chromatiaceae bacterium]|nr:biopolymer transporter ExbD [Chromatiaceae bacterium]